MTLRSSNSGSQDGLVNRCLFLLEGRQVAGSRPLVEIEAQPISDGPLQYFHRMRIGPWLCQIKLTGLCIVLEVRPHEGGSVAFAMVGATTRVLSVGEGKTNLAIVKDPRDPRIQLGQDVSAAAEIAYQFGLQVGPGGDGRNEAFFACPAFESILRVMATKGRAINPLFCKPYRELGNWYAVAKLRLLERETGTVPTQPPKRRAQPRVEQLPLDGPQRNAADAIRVPRSTLLAWGHRHGIHGKTLGEMRIAFLDAATLVLLEHLSNSSALEADPITGVSPWVDELLKLTQEAQRREDQSAPYHPEACAEAFDVDQPR
jgi:hypothetical protein